MKNIDSNRNQNLWIQLDSKTAAYLFGSDSTFCQTGPEDSGTMVNPQNIC